MTPDNTDLDAAMGPDEDEDYRRGGPLGRLTVGRATRAEEAKARVDALRAVLDKSLTTKEEPLCN